MQRTQSEGRRHSPAQRSQILAAYRRSGLAQKEFAAQAGIGHSTLTLWLRKAAAPEEVAGAALVAVPNLWAADSPVPSYRLQLPGGVVLEVASGFRREELASLLELVRTPC